MKIPKSRLYLWPLLISLLTLNSYPSYGENSKTLPTPNSTPNKLVSYGSDTLANLMYFWMQSYSERYPQIKLELHSEGSSTAANGLINHASSLGPMSRLMSVQEVAEFKQKFGYAPTPIKVGMDAIAVFVNRDNPLTSISLPQLDAVFSNNRKCGAMDNIQSWNDLGLNDNWRNKRIELIGRNKVSGTYTFFRQKVLCDGQFKSRVLNQPGSVSLIQMVSHSLYSIGYSGIGYKTSGVKALSIKNSQSQIIEATPQTVRNQSYPLARFLYIYVNLPSNKSLPASVSNFLHIALSNSGQKVVEQDGYVALSEEMRLQELNKLLP